MSNVNVLVTGGAGYVGSHVIVELLGAGCDVVVADNFHNSRPGVRDYVHVVDLAKGHVTVVNKIMTGSLTGIKTYNMNGGTGGASVLEVIAAFQEASGVRVPYDVLERRPGDVAKMVASSKLARDELGWKAEKSLLRM
ncbi:UDP-glucose 4-epimerase-like, partial [Ixodes scapularis]